jgi:hypothetical protein
VQTYIEAKSLQTWLDAGRTFSEEDLISIAKQLLTILDSYFCSDRLDVFSFAVIYTSFFGSWYLDALGDYF